MPLIWWWNRDRRDRTSMDRQRAAMIEDYQLVFASEAGQRVLADILRRCRVMDDVFDGNPTVVAYNEGKRRAALEIVQMINDDPVAARAMAATGQTEELFP